MRKIISFMVCLVALAAATPSVAQQKVMTNPNALLIDSASGTTGEGPKIQIPTYQKTFSIVLKTTKISGTISGTVEWQGSENGTDWWTISSTSLTDATKNYGYKEVDKGFIWYRALITPGSGASLSYSATCFYSK